MSENCKNTLTVGTDNYIQISGLHREDGTTITTVTSVVAELNDSEGDQISGSDITLTLVSGTSDTYAGSIPDTVVLVAGTTYELEIIAIADGFTSRHTELIVAGSAFTSIVDLPGAIASIDEAIATGAQSVTIDGITVNYRSLSEMTTVRRMLVDRDTSGKYCKRRRVQRIKLGGF